MVYKHICITYVRPRVYKGSVLHPLHTNASVIKDNLSDEEGNPSAPYIVLPSVIAS
jgi:hypothetical protein